MSGMAPLPDLSARPHQESSWKIRAGDEQPMWLSVADEAEVRGALLHGFLYRLNGVAKDIGIGESSL